MAVAYVPFDGGQVSAEWHVVLTAARRAGVVFELDSGHRTMAQQQRLVDQKGVWSPSNPHGAARPSATAPHIRDGRIDHAIDVNQLDGGADRLDAWCTHAGSPLDNTVPPEPWHKEIRGGEAELRRFVARLRLDPVIRPFYLRPRHPNDKAAVVTLQRLLRGIGLSNVASGRYGIWTRRAVRRFQADHRLPVDGIVGAATWRALRVAADPGRRR